MVPGFRGARLLRRTVGDETEFVSLTFFDDLEAVRSFAGSDYETAVVADQADDVLIRFDSIRFAGLPRRDGIRDLTGYQLTVRTPATEVMARSADTTVRLSVMA